MRFPLGCLLKAEQAQFPEPFLNLCDVLSPVGYVGARAVLYELAWGAAAHGSTGQ